VRIDAKSIARAAALEALGRTGLSQKQMASNAEVKESALSDALNGHRGRALEVGWLLAQDEDFVTAFLDAVARRLKLKTARRVKLRPQDVGAIVRELMERVG
jgi:transcriptional regulator with XRE-family HTH domain